MAFRARNVFGIFEKRAPEEVNFRVLTPSFVFTRHKANASTRKGEIWILVLVLVFMLVSRPVLQDALADKILKSFRSTIAKFMTLTPVSTV